MPLLKFHLVKGRTAAEIDTLLDAAHDAMVASFGVPERDRYQVLSEHEPSHVRLLDTGLGIVRTDKIVLIEVVSRPRTGAAKQAFYRNICDALRDRCGIDNTDVIISFVENTDEDWSFGYGRAQFITGEL